MARKEENDRLTLQEEEEEEEKEGEEKEVEELVQEDERVSPRQLKESDCAVHRMQISDDYTPTPVVLENEIQHAREHATHTIRRISESGTTTESSILASPLETAPLPEVHQGLSTLNLDSTACDKEEIKSVDSCNLKVTDNVTQFHTEAGNGSYTGVGLRKSVSAEELMKEQLKSYLEKEKRARKAKCLAPLEDGMPLLTAAAATPEVPTPTHALHRKKTLHRQRSSSATSTSSWSTSPSPTIGKSPKSPWLVVSPTLFCPSLVSGSQTVGTVGHVPPTAVYGSKNSKSTSPGNVSDCDSNGRQIVSPESSIHHDHSNPRPTPKGKERAVVNPSPKGDLRSARSTTKLGKLKEHRKTSPSLSDLFLPDNVTTLNPASGSRSYESRKTPESSVAHGPRKLVEFSSSLPHSHTSSLKKPIPLRTTATGSVSGNVDKDRCTSVRNTTTSSHLGQTTALSSPNVTTLDESFLVTGNNTLSKDSVTLKGDDGSEVEQRAAVILQHQGNQQSNLLERGRLSENTNNCNSNETDSLQSDPKPPQKQKEGQGSCDTQGTNPGEASQQHMEVSPKGNPLLGKHGKADDFNEDPNPPSKRSRQRPRKSETKHSVPTSSCTQQKVGNESHLSTSQKGTPSQEAAQQEISPMTQDSPVTSPTPTKKKGRPRKSAAGKRGRPRKNVPTTALQGISGAGSGSSESKPEDPHSHSSSPSVIVPSAASVTSESTMDDGPHVQGGERKQGEEFPGQLGGEEKESPLATGCTVATPTELMDSSTTPATESDLNPSPQKRKRGRPRKSASKPPEVSINVAVNSDPDCSPSPLKKRRGRPPRKDKDTSTNVTPASSSLHCEKCDNVYATKSGLKAHLLAAHPPELGVSTNRFNLLVGTPS